MLNKIERGLSTALVIFGSILLLAAGAWASPQERVIYSFWGTNGDGPRAVLIRDALGNFYGTTYVGGAYGDGTVFELTHISGGDWKGTLLYSFRGLSDGSKPGAGVIFDSAGNLYGTTMFGGTSGYGVVFKLTPTSNGWNESVLYNFTGGNDGGFPQAGVIQDAAGNLYGTTSAAGNSNCYGLIEYAGCGAVFELSPVLSGWSETTLHTFTGGSDGGTPMAGLIVDSAGNLYGTTMGGGTLNSCYDGCGTVFRLSPTGSGGWRETLLLQFRSATGAYPTASLILDSEGNLYGTTSGRGNTNANCPYGCGTIFKLTPSSGGGWLASTLHIFTGGNDGGEPMAGLVFDSTGYLYGTTYGGGSGNGGCYLGCGVVFKLTPGSRGWNESVLHAFDTAQDGAGPLAGVLLDESGDVYGTTPSGGNGLPTGVGTVYEILP